MSLFLSPSLRLGLHGIQVMYVITIPTIQARLWTLTLDHYRKSICIHTL